MAGDGRKMKRRVVFVSTMRDPREADQKNSGGARLAI
jgi:hypothetical protein